MNPLSEACQYNSTNFHRTSAGLLTACTHRAGGKSAFVWNYFEVFVQLILNESALNIAAPFFMKTPLLKSNFLINPSIILAAAVLTAGSLLAPFARAATDPLMPKGAGGVWPFDP